MEGGGREEDGMWRADQERRLGDKRKIESVTKAKYGGRCSALLSLPSLPLDSHYSALLIFHRLLHRSPLTSHREVLRAKKKQSSSRDYLSQNL